MKRWRRGEEGNFPPPLLLYLPSQSPRVLGGRRKAEAEVSLPVRGSKDEEMKEMKKEEIVPPSLPLFFFFFLFDGSDEG